MEESEHLAVAMLFFSPANMKLDDNQHKMAWEKPVPTSRRTPVQHNLKSSSRVVTIHWSGFWRWIVSTPKRSSSKAAG
jgi:hypothetical protein